ncbi:hypothetical protein D3C72_2321670 [compost metagenome]
MQGNHRQPIGWAKQVSGQFDMAKVQADFFHFCAHAGPCCQRSNNPLIKLAVSVGRSSGNM